MVNNVGEMMAKFGVDGKVVGGKVFNSGHINTTCLVVMENKGKRKNYVLQRINTNVFKRPVEVMENIANVTAFIRDGLEEVGCDASRMVLNFKQAPNGNYFVVDDMNGYWRLYDYIDKSVTFDQADSHVLYEAGKAFGEFQNMLSNYPSHELYDTIPDFHNTPKRYQAFKAVLRKDPVGRARGVQAEINQFLALENIASQMQRMLDGGKLPLRVTHNDTKCNNVLFDEDTKKHLCVIDLDTVMPGLAGFDFGDAMRFASNTCAEDCTDLDAVQVDLDKFEAFTKGFIESVGSSLTKEELDTLVLGTITMTTECGLRFLTDYIDGDNYFKVSHPTHNLERARCQLTLAKRMIEKQAQMKQIVNKCVRQNSNKGKMESGDVESSQ